MKVENDKIKDLFSSKLGNFEPEVPASLWGGLDQLLSSQPSPATDPNSVNTSNTSTGNAASSSGNASILKVAAVIIGLAAAIAAGFLFIPGDSEEEIINDSKNIVTEEPKTPLVEEPDTTSTIVLPMEPLVVMAETPVYKQDDNVPVPEERPVVTETPETKEELPKETKERPVDDAPLVLRTESLLPKKTTSKGFSLGIKADMNMFADNITERGGNLLFSRNERSALFNELLEQENSEFVLEHKRPISFGVTVSKQISSRLSLETGLVYTRLSSKIRSNSMFNLSESQNFNYLGVPLALNYNFYELGKTRFYISLGGMVQKDISGKYVSNMNFSISDINDPEIAHSIFYSEPYYINQSISQSNPQFSVYSTLGVSYPLYKKLYLYGAVGGAYYFDAGNRYRTIYSDKKTQLNLNLGIKFDF